MREELHAEMERIGYVFKYQPEPVQEPEKNGEENDALWDWNYEVEGYGFFNTMISHSNRNLGFTGGIGMDNDETIVEAAKNYMAGLNGEGLSAGIRQRFDEMMGAGVLPDAAPSLVWWDSFANSPNFHAEMFVAAPTPTMLERWALLQKLESEAFVKIIAGAEPIDYFDRFVEDWFANGGTEITAEVNAWYQSLR